MKLNDKHSAMAMEFSSELTTMCAGIRAEFAPRALFFVFIDDKFRCPKESVAFLHADRLAIVVRALIIRFCIDLLLDEFQAFRVVAFFFQTLEEKIST